MSDINHNFMSVVSEAASRLSESDKRSAWIRSGRGVSIYTHESQLDEYLFLYGEMHIAKMCRFLPAVPFGEIGGRVALVDWGCGQGLASACALDCMRGMRSPPTVEAVRLIEISDVARARAERVVGRYGEVRDVKGYPWDLEALAGSGLDLPAGVPVVHLFSNILDVEAIDLKRLAEVLLKLTAGHVSYVLSVSPKTPLERASRLKAFFGLVSGLQPIDFGMESLCVPHRQFYPFPTCSCYGLVYRISGSVAEDVAPFIPDPGYTEDELLAFAAADMAEELVDAVAAGVSVNCRDLAGHTPLVLAAKYGARKAVLELLRLGADKDAANAKGATALYFAAKYGFIECVQDLLKAGADMELSPRTSRVTPYLVAVRHRNESVASVLAAAGADISARDARGRDADDYYRVEPTKRTWFARNSGGVCHGGVV